MNIGIKGVDHSGQTTWIHFERVPGAKEPQVRIRTADRMMYVSEANFTAMIVQLFGSGDPNYVPRHGRTE